jgi:hypothetical protein
MSRSVQEKLGNPTMKKSSNIIYNTPPQNNKTQQIKPLPLLSRKSPGTGTSTGSPGAPSVTTGGSSNNASLLLKQLMLANRLLEEKVKNYENGTIKPAAPVSAPVPVPSRVPIVGQGGLFGDPSIPNVISGLPALKGNSAIHYSEWARLSCAYFKAHGLMELVTLSPSVALHKAITMDTLYRSPEAILSILIRLHSKLATAIQTAIEPILGTEIVNSIDYIQTKWKTENGLLADAEIPFEVTSSEIGGAKVWSIKNEQSFITDNANYLWERLKEKSKYTALEKSALSEQVMGLRFKYGTDPQVFKNEYLHAREQASQAGITLSDDLQLSIWLKALPQQLNVLSQALSVNSTSLTWEGIFEAINHEFLKQKITPVINRVNKSGGETALFAAPVGGESEKPENSTFTGKCFRCGTRGHMANACFEKHPELKHKSGNSSRGNSGFGNSGRRGNSGFGNSGRGKPPHGRRHSGKVRFHPYSKENAKKTTTSPTDHVAVTVEPDTLDMLLQLNETGGDLAMAASDSTVPKKVYFIFDSGATSHVTNNRELLTDIKSVPESSLTTAIKGSRSVIRERGKIRLNDTWVIQDVAYLRNGFTNLISEGKLCDAGYEITKNKDWIKVTDKDGKTVLTGFRYERLWVYGTFGSKPSVRSINTLLKRKKVADLVEEVDDAEVAADDVAIPPSSSPLPVVSSSRPGRPIPKKKPTQAEIHTAKAKAARAEIAARRRSHANEVEERKSS